MSFLDSLFSDGDASTPQSPLDQLFSVTPAARQQANSQALMSMAAGLLQASAPSRLPVNLGQALGSAYMQGQGAYDNALTNRMKQQAMAGELAKNKLGVMQSLAGQAAMAKAFGQPVPDYLSQLTGSGGTTVASPVNPLATMANGTAPTDAGTPTPAGADSASTPGTWSAQQSPMGGFNFAPAAGIPDDSASNPVAPTSAPSSQPLLRMPPGMNGATAYALSLNPSTAPIIQKAIENQYPSPTQLEQYLISKGVKPGSDEWNATMSAGIFKDTNVPMESHRPGSWGRDPATGAVKYFPDVPKGGLPVLDANGNPTGAVKPMPGAAAVAATQSSAEASGPAKYNFEKVFDPTTNTYVYRSRSDMASNGGGAAGGGNSAGAFSGYHPPRGGSLQAGPALGAESATNAFAKGNAEDALGLQRLAADAPNRKANILSMESYLNDFKSGKGADAINNLKSYANTWLPNGFGFDPKKMSSQEIFTKGATQILGQQFKAMGTAGADNSLQTLKSGFPNTEMQDMANRYLLHTMAGNEDAITVRNNEMQKWIAKNGPQSVGAFNSEFNKHFDPRVFSSHYMNQDELTHMVQSMTPKQAQQFRAARAFALQHGWLQ